MEFTAGLFALFPALSSALTLPNNLITAQAEPEARIPHSYKTIINAERIIERTSLWPWERPPHIIGEYPDGRQKCKIMSMTAGHTEGPCPERPSDVDIQKILRQEWCENNCCDENFKACREHMH